MPRAADRHFGAAAGRRRSRRTFPSLAHRILQGFS
jgi:hypothetical protein